MTASDAQVRIIMRERRRGRTHEQASVSANLRSRQTVAQYEGLGRLPRELRQPRQYRTRPALFTEDWRTIEQMQEDAPSLEPRHCLNGCVSNIPSVTRPASCAPSNVRSPRGGHCISRRSPSWSRAIGRVK